MTKTGGSDKSFVLGYFDSDSAIAKNVLRRFLLRRQVRPTSCYTLLRCIHAHSDASRTTFLKNLL